MSIAPVVSLFPGAHLYTVCPSNAMSGFNYAESPPAANQFAYTSSDASTNLMAAIARCDADVANASPCTGVDLWKGLIEVFPDVTVVGGASVVNFGVPEGFAIRQSSKGTFIQKYGDNFPANCFVCTSTADGACCLSPSVTTCDTNGVACLTGAFAYHGACVSACPATGTYTSAGGVCVDCTNMDPNMDPNAASCSSSEPLSCTAPYQLVAGVGGAPNACKPCADGTFADASSGGCSACAPNVATCTSLANIETCDPGYKIGEAGTITPTSTYDDGKTCPDTTAPRPSGLIAPACVCNDNFSTSCNASGANTCVEGFAPVNNANCLSFPMPTFVCAPCAGYFTSSSEFLTDMRPVGDNLHCIICPSTATLDKSTRTSTCTCKYDNFLYIAEFNQCFYDGAPPTNGVDGTNGKDGAAGSNGTIGYNGTAGLNGKDGANGTVGPAGADGKNGTNGKNGAAGARGPRGRQGKPGRKGKNAPVIVVIEPSHKSHHSHGHHEKGDRRARPAFHPKPLHLEGHKDHWKGSHGKGKGHDHRA